MTLELTIDPMITIAYGAERVRHQTHPLRAKSDSLSLVPNANLASALRKDYIGMQEMTIRDAPEFYKIIATIETFETEINS